MKEKGTAGWSKGIVNWNLMSLETQRGVATPLPWIGPVEFGVCLAEEVQHMKT